MSRPKKSGHTREKLILEGIELLKEQGYHGTGIKQILDRVNVPKGSFYNFFESKEKFVSEIIEYYNLDLLEQIDTFIANSKENPVEKIKTAYGFAIKEIEKKGLKGCLVGNLAGELGNSSTECLEKMKKGVKLWKLRFNLLFEQAQEQDLLRKDLTPDELSDIFWNAWQGSLLRMKFEGDTFQLYHTLNLLTDVLFKK